ncbi:MAG: response regulator transcription factor [Erysipelotrichaceae bacterium]|nr:response regulator transcription factor [Erysipelotrichaceae bacterium]
MRLLVVEDEEMIAHNIKRHLKREGYAVDECHNGLDALDYVKTTSYDVIILDLMLPGLDGFSVIKEMRQHQINTKILILSAKSGVNDRIKGLDLGADDYMVKPFSLEELSARIRVLIRRSHNTDHQSAILKAQNLELDTYTRKAIIDGKEITLTAKEYAILEYLMMNQGIVISRDRLLEHVWSYDYDGASNIIDVYIRTIRRKLGKDNPIIETLRGVGYVIR